MAFYVQRLEDTGLPLEAFKPVFQRFGEDGKWPTVSDILKAVGMNVQREQEKPTARAETKARDMNDPKLTGTWVWEKVAHLSGDDEREATLVFEKYAQDLDLAGWNILRQETSRVELKAQVAMGERMVEQSRWVYRALFFCIK